MTSRHINFRLAAHKHPDLPHQFGMDFLSHCVSDRVWMEKWREKVEGSSGESFLFEERMTPLPLNFHLLLYFHFILYHSSSTPPPPIYTTAKPISASPAQIQIISSGSREDVRETTLFHPLSENYLEDWCLTQPVSSTTRPLPV